MPYDRTMLTKFFPASVDKIFLRSPDFLKEYDIDILNGVNVVDIDNTNKSVKLESGVEFKYDKLLMATGGSALVPNIPGKDNSNVYVLRTYDDLEKIKNACKDAKDIVILGGSFIGMESASTLKKSFPNANVTVIEKYKTPFYASLGPEIGEALQR